MAFPDAVIADIARAKDLISDLNVERFERLYKGVRSYEPRNYKELSGLLVNLDFKAGKGVFDDVSERLHAKLMMIIGGVSGFVKLSQTITFPSLPTGKQIGDDDFSPGATASSGLPVSYSSSNLSVATIVDGLIHIVGLGSAVITATQGGDETYNSATPVTRTITIQNLVTVSSGFTNINPVGDVFAVNLPVTQSISVGTTQYTINFTSGANLQYLVHEEPITEPIKTVWVNNIEYNFGLIEDAKYRPYVESGAFRRYFTRVLFPFYTGTYTIQFKTS